MDQTQYSTSIKNADRLPWVSGLNSNEHIEIEIDFRE